MEEGEPVVDEGVFGFCLRNLRQLGKERIGLAFYKIVKICITPTW